MSRLAPGGLAARWGAGARHGLRPERVDEQPVVSEPVDEGQEQVQFVLRLREEPAGQAGQVFDSVLAALPPVRVILQGRLQPGRRGLQGYETHDCALVPDRVPPAGELVSRPAVL